MNIIGAIGRNVVLPLRDFIYPPVCFTCDNLRTKRTSRICEDCWNSIPRIDRTHRTWREIKGKLDQEGLLDGLLSCFLFEKEGKLQEIIHLLKYRAIRSVGMELGREIGNAIIRDPLFREAHMLVPVPLHKLKLRERGYNQSIVLCKGISEITHIPVRTDILVRGKYTLSQTQLSLKERKENVGGAFSIKRKRFPDAGERTLILVDDVVTTGSTINACAQVLLDHGARRVLAASAALAQ